MSLVIVASFIHTLWLVINFMSNLIVYRICRQRGNATVMKDHGKAIDSATVAMKKVEQREAEESKVPQKKKAVK